MLTPEPEQRERQRQAKYSLTDEHRAQLEPWAKRWIANAMSTAPMDDADRAAMRTAVKGMYEAAGLTPPPDHRIVFVPSPFVLRFAGGIAAAVWHLRRNGHSAATLDATRDATEAATLDATLDATLAATRAAGDQWFHFPCDVAAIARQFLGASYLLGLRSAQYAWRMWQGGNQWSAWSAYISFFRHIAQLPIDYTKWEHWEQATIHGGPRIMHPDFCLICDRPEVLTVDEESRPHGVDAPCCRWRDGSALYSWHGVRVPAKYYQRAHTARGILAEPNAEVRRALMERYDEKREKGAFLQDCGARVVDSAVQPMRVGQPDAINELLVIDLPDDPEERMVALKVIDPSTGRVYIIRVPPDQKTVRGALAWSFDIPEKQYVLEQES